MSKVHLNITGSKLPQSIHYTTFALDSKPNLASGISTCKRNYFAHAGFRENLVGAMIGKNRNFAYQVEPGIEFMDKNTLANKLYKILKTIEEVPETVKAFIFGGIKYSEESNFAKISFDTYNQLADAFESLDIPVSKLCGKEPNSAPDNMIMLNNGIYIRNEKISPLIDKNPQMTNDELMEILEAEYSDIELDNINLNVFDRVV